MKANYAVILPRTLKHEGGWADHPKDPGGATMRGITIGRYSQFLGRQATKAELKAIPEAHVQAIYRQGYWDPVQGDALPSGMDYTVFDASVNSGIGRGPKWLQKAVGVKADGKVGKGTITAARNISDPIGAIKRANANRMGFLKGLKIWGTFGKGWSRRVADVEAFSMKLAVGVETFRELAPQEAAKAQKVAKGEKQATAIPTAGAAGGFSLDSIPQEVIVIVALAAVAVVVMLIGQARHSANRAAAYEALMKETADA